MAEEKTGPVVLGELQEAEVQMLQGMRQRAGDLVHQIGNMEVQKARLMGYISDVEIQSKNFMDEISKRMGIAEGTRWQIQGNQIIQIGATPQPPLQVVADEPVQEEVEAEELPKEGE